MKRSRVCRRHLEHATRDPFCIAFATLTGSAVLGACAADAPVQLGTGTTCDAIDAPVARMDSAGIDVVTNVEPALRRRDVPRVAPEPSVTIGVMHGDSAYEFGSIVAATRMSDGRIVVADRQASHLRVFDANGRHLRTVGSRGEGPGEYRAIGSLLRATGDTLWIEDGRLVRVTRLDASLDLVDTFTLPMIPWSRPARTGGGRPLSGRMLVRPRGVLDDGTFIAMSNVPVQSTAEVTGVKRSRRMLHRVRPRTEQFDSLGVAPAVSYFEFFHDDGVTFGDALHGFVLSLAVTEDGYFHGTAESFEIAKYSPDGSVARVIRVCEERDAIGDAQLERAIEERLASFPPEALVYEEPAYRGIEWPRTAPAYLELLVDEAGRLWARDFTFPGEPQRWKLFDRDGRWLGDVSTPAELEVLEIGSDYILGRHTDELGVQSVRVYALEPGGTRERT